MKAIIKVNGFEREATGSSEEINEMACWASMGAPAQVEYPNGLTVKYQEYSMVTSSRKAVVNNNGEYIRWSAVKSSMDPNIYEKLIEMGFDGFKDAQGFFEAYADMHYLEYNEDFAPWVGGEW